jgi:uncharacterized protein
MEVDKKFFFQILGLVFVAFGAMILTFNPGLFGGGGLGRLSQITTQADQVIQIIDSTDPSRVKATLEIELADTPQKQSQGLSGREMLATNSGMLFPYDTLKKPTFWMKGMLIPIDIIWILNDQIVDILPNVPPPEKGQSDDTLPRYSPVTEINKVLEVNAGFSQSNNIKIGDKILLNNPQTDSLEAYPTPSAEANSLPIENSLPIQSPIPSE